MIENILSGILGQGSPVAPGEPKQEEPGGIKSLLPILAVLFLIYIGIKLLAPKAEQPQPPLPPL